MIQGNDIRLPAITRFVRSFDDSKKTTLNGTPHLSGTPGIKGGSNGRVCRVESIQEGGPFYNAGYSGGSYKGGDAIYWLGFDFGRVNAAYGRYDGDVNGFAGEITPACVCIPLFIQVYHAAIPTSMVDISTLTNQISALSNKVTQLTQQIESMRITNFGTPNHAARVDLTPGQDATTVTYTAPTNGYIWGFFMRADDGSTYIDLTIDGVIYSAWSRPGSYYVNGHMSVIMPIKQGSVVTITRRGGNWRTARSIYFIPTE